MHLFGFISFILQAAVDNTCCPLGCTAPLNFMFISDCFFIHESSFFLYMYNVFGRTFLHDSQRLFVLHAFACSVLVYMRLELIWLDFVVVARHLFHLSVMLHTFPLFVYYLRYLLFYTSFIVKNGNSSKPSLHWINKSFCIWLPQITFSWMCYYFNL